MERVRFEDIVTRVNTKEDRFNTDKIYYVGGEHIESNDIKVHQRGIIKGSTIGPMFYCGFKAGDVLFVTRNPHLRKCAIVDFDGICSEKTFVLGTKDSSRLLQEYLPLIMQSDDFWAYCEENKSGGVNFFVNWSTLANYEFELPSLDEQRVLADKLWAAYEVKESYKNLLAQTDKLLHAQFEKMFGEETNIKSWKDVLTIRNGKAYPKEYLEEGPYPIYGSGGVMGYAEDYLFDEDTIIVGRKGNINNPILVREKYWTVDTAFCLDIDKKILNPIYFYNWCQQFDFTYFNKQGVLPSLTRTDLYTIKMPVPPMQKQLEFVRIAEQAEQTKASLNKGIEAIEAVIRSLIAEGTTKV